MAERNRVDPKAHAMNPPTKAEAVMGLTSLPVHARRLAVAHVDSGSSEARLHVAAAPKRGRAPTTPLCAMCGGWSTPEPAVWVAADRRRDCGRWLAVRADLSRIRSSQLPDLGACSSKPTAKCRAEPFRLRYDEAQFVR